MHLKKTLLLFVAMGLALMGFNRFLHRNMPAPPLTLEEKRVTETLFNRTKPQCIGRYVFDVPETFVNTMRDYVYLNDFRISSQRLYRPAFEQRLQLREQELKNAKTVDPIDAPFLKAVHRLSGNSIIFDRNEDVGTAGWGRLLEGHLYIDGVAFIVRVEITDYSDPRHAENRAFFLRNGRPVVEANTKPQKLAEMQALMSRLSGRKDEDIPTQPGFCIPEGFVRDNGRKNKERVAFAYEGKDFNFYTDTNNTLGQTESLLERSGEIIPSLSRNNINTMRKGKKIIPEMEAEEWLVRGKQELNSTDVLRDLYFFTFYANEKRGDYRHPILSATLNNRRLSSTTYSDAQLVDIWDRIVGSFRFRPNAFERE